MLTSATVPPQLEARLGLPPKTTDHLEVGSPFPFETCALLYCAKHLPDPRRPGAREALHDELGSLIAAAGGRTLALFTSWRAMHDAADALRLTLPFEVLAQGDKPKAKLLDAFSSDHAACLFATMSFWQGVDVPGPTLSLVTLDRLPFSRPDDPLLQARRDRGRRGRVPRRRPAPRRHPAGPGGGTAHPVVRPTTGWWPSSTRAWPPPTTGTTSWRACRPCDAPSTTTRSSPFSRTSPEMPVTPRFAVRPGVFSSR